MHKADEAILKNICGGSIPPKTENLYEDYQRAWMRIGNGPLTRELLIVIAVQSGGVFKEEKKINPFSDVPLKSYVSVHDSITKQEKYQGIFLGCCDGLQEGQLRVSFYGNEDDVKTPSATTVRLLNGKPSWAIVKEEEDARITKQLASKPEGEEAEKMSKAQRERQEKLNEAYQNHPWHSHRTGTVVEVCAPGQAMQKGYFVKVDDSCKLLVRLPLMPYGSRDVLFHPGDVSLVRTMDGIGVWTTQVSEVVCDLLGYPYAEALEKHPLGDVPKYAKATIVGHKSKDFTGWFVGITPDMRAQVRISTGHKANRDRVVDFEDVIVDKDEDGNFTVDQSGFDSAGLSEHEAQVQSRTLESQAS